MPLLDGEPAYPALYAATDVGAGKHQKSYFRFLAAEITALMVAALPGAVMSWLPDSAGFRRLGAVVLALALIAALVFRLWRHIGEYEERWFRSRALAESIKVESWLFMMRAEPYQGQDAAQVFSRRTKVLLESDLETFDSPDDVPAGATSQITDDMRTVRLAPLVQRRAYYQQHRAINQKNWYVRRGGQHKKNGRNWAWGSGILEGLAIVLAIVAAATAWSVDFLGLLVTGVAAGMAWILSKDFKRLATTYGFVAQDLLRIESEFEAVHSEQQLHDYVREIERALSREHTYWLSRRLGA